MLPLSNPTPEAALAGRVWRPGIGPALVALRGADVVDITCKAHPTMRDLCEAPNPAETLRQAQGEAFASLEDLSKTSLEARGPDALRWLAPCDLQAVKACGVTFAEFDGRAGDRGAGRRRSPRAPRRCRARIGGRGGREPVGNRARLGPMPMQVKAATAG
jgi:fumarylacetoacetate (FAA) hydrolase family protein